MSKSRKKAPAAAKKGAPAGATRRWTAAETKRLLDAVWNHEASIECPACGGSVVDGGSDSHILRIRCTRCPEEASYNFG